MVPLHCPVPLVIENRYTCVDLCRCNFSNTIIQRFFFDPEDRLLLLPKPDERFRDELGLGFDWLDCLKLLLP
jgi:hypothetical protein